MLITRVAALLACAAVVGVLLAAKEAPVTPAPPVVKASPVSVKHYNCKAGELRSYISLKRQRTWKWQEAALVPRTRSSYQEKRARGCAYLKWLKRLWQGRADDAFLFYADLRDPQQAICHVFGNYCSEALAVARCESGHSYSVRAQNGQYLGMFQMGSYARSKYGHGYTPLEQARAAYAYFADAGYDWSPWSCKP